MLSWIKKYKKRLNFFGGLLVLIITALLYFWSVKTGVSTTPAQVSGTEARFARLNQTTQSVTKQSTVNPAALLGSKLRENDQAQILFMILLILGTLMVVYSLFTQSNNDNS